MNSVKKGPHIIKSISELHQVLRLPKPKHPMISVFEFEEICNDELMDLQHFFLDFYCVSIKKNFKGKLQYGQQYYDYDEGVMSFVSPRQLLAHIQADDSPTQGISLLFHSDFLKGHPLSQRLHEYGFFSYELNEALHLSEEEELVMQGVLRNIEREYQSGIDQFSQNVMISLLEVLLQYSNRFYNRQFLTRKPANDDLLMRLERVLTSYYNSNDVLEKGIPTVQHVSKELGVSANYLSDMLRSTTGQTTLQHIQNAVMEKAKVLLTTTNMSVGEIAYSLGFEYPQSFNKLFKKKVNATPLAFRKSFQ